MAHAPQTTTLLTTSSATSDVTDLMIGSVAIQVGWQMLRDCPLSTSAQKGAPYSGRYLAGTLRRVGGL